MAWFQIKVSGKYSDRDVQEGTGNWDLEFWIKVALETYMWDLPVPCTEMAAKPSEWMPAAGERAGELNTVTVRNPECCLPSCLTGSLVPMHFGLYVPFYIPPRRLPSLPLLLHPLLKPPPPAAPSKYVTLSRGLSQAPSLSSSFPSWLDLFLL